MQTTTLLHLGPRDIVAERPFTAPEHSLAEALIMERMCARLHRTLAEAGEAPANPDAGEIHIQYVQEEGGRMHRMVILNRAALLAPVERPVVGFFGRLRGEANPAVLQDVDTELVQEFLEHRYVLSYSSLELDDGNWGNLVVLEHIDGVEHWRLSQKHAYAAGQLAPLYYSEIRLHNGVLPGGIASPGLAITRTKYFEFGDVGAWRAIREERNSA